MPEKKYKNGFDKSHSAINLSIHAKLFVSAKNKKEHFRWKNFTKKGLSAEKKTEDFGLHSTLASNKKTFVEGETESNSRPSAAQTSENPNYFLCQTAVEVTSCFVATFE